MNLPGFMCSGFARALCLLSLLSCISPVPGLAGQSGGSAPANSPAKPTPLNNISAPGAPVDTKTFKVGPQDVLKIIVWREQDFTGLYTVHSDGKITLPLVGDIQAGGHTAEEIQNNVTAALSKLIQKPNVTVTVQQVLSQKYYMDGEIIRPGE